jgi:hypothetical protein
MHDFANEAHVILLVDKGPDIGTVSWPSWETNVADAAKAACACAKPRHKSRRRPRLAFALRDARHNFGCGRSPPTAADTLKRRWPFAIIVDKEN